MKTVECSNCHNNAVRLNESIKINGKVYCASCFEAAFPTKKDLEGQLIEKEIDPTICSSCSKDYGSLVLNKISTYPICNDCEIKIKNRTFPLWVKGFLIGVIAIVIFSFIWNWKYYEAYSNIKKSNDLFAEKDFAAAANLMTSVSNKVPEVKDLTILASYFKGIALLADDKSQAALVELQKCDGILPPEYGVPSLIVQARVGASFDNKDYEGFLAASKESLSLDTTDASSWTSVASAYSCLYAERGNEDDKLQANEYIQRAKMIDDTSMEMKQYYNLVDYRIQTRDIIRRQEFNKRYPNGWTKN